MLLDASVLISMLGAGVVVEISEPSLVTDSLYPEELEYIARASEKRKAEFGTARMCARRALRRLGVPPSSLVPYADGSPRWPEGVKGSITHTAGCCAVVLTKDPLLVGIGIDIEQDTPLASTLQARVCTERERAWMEQYDHRERARWGKLFFSAKEAFYKCQYETTRSGVDFQDVDLQFNIAEQSFSIVALAKSGRAWDLVGRATGRFQPAAGLIITTASLAASNRPA